jgi:hypothetical protein
LGAFLGAFVSALPADLRTVTAGFFTAFFGGDALLAVDLLIHSPCAGLYPLGEPMARRQAGI